jgi:DNA-binding HxlR family transcriptional regulator
MSTDLETRRLFEEVLGCKWTLAVLGRLQSGIVRPGALERAIPGITTKVLHQRLRKLERFALVQRRLVADRPLHVEYALTPKGRQLVRLVDAVQRYALRWGIPTTER